MVEGEALARVMEVVAGVTMVVVAQVSPVVGELSMETKTVRVGINQKDLEKEVRRKRLPGVSIL